MTFLRSKKGIENRALFTRVQFTVYVETAKNEYENNFTDISFWRGFFSYYYRNLEIRFVPLGGKPHVLAMANKIVSDDIKRSLCAMDRDYDDLYGKLHADERIFYTFGYGAENDLLRQEVVDRMVKSLFPTLSPKNSNIAEINDYIERTIQNHRICFLADQIGKGRHNCPLNRDNPRSDIVHSEGDLPVSLRKEEILRRFKCGQKRREEQMILPPRITKQTVPAHHFFEIVYHTIRRRLYKLNGKRIDKGSFGTLLCALSHDLFESLAGPEAAYFSSIGSRELSLYS
ncbi:MAG: DUF4435 domain-containing protein [Arenimonas sp.]|nr:DUF4435 domain-containing protein [Rhizobium sp.]MBW8446503.1 DUF4435 domain-containing protein [Arenimonas sp.]